MINPETGRQRVAVVVYVDLDPIPGAFHTEDSAVNNIRGILEGVINHYNPTVEHAPESLQPSALSEQTEPSYEGMDFGPFASKEMAERLSKACEDHLLKFGTLSVSNVYELMGQSPTFLDYKRGWSAPMGSSIGSEGNLFFLWLPVPKNF